MASGEPMNLNRLNDQYVNMLWPIVCICVHKFPFPTFRDIFNTNAVRHEMSTWGLTMLWGGIN